MRNALWTRLGIAAACVVVMGVALAACGGSSDSSSSGSTAAGTTAAESSEAGGSGADYVKVAEEKVAPIVGQPSPFSVAEKLEGDPKGSTIAFMDCGLPYCALFYELLQEPAAMLGVKLERIKAGVEAGTAGPAFDTAVAKKPDAVIVMATNIQLWSKQLKELQADNIPVVTLSVPEAEDFGIVSPRGPEAMQVYEGQMEANYVIAHMNPEANAVAYEVPELSFTTTVAESFKSEMEAGCPKCSVRIAQIPAASVGTKSSNEIVSDLQSHPDTNVALFTNPEISVGLFSSLSAAGIEIESLSSGPIPGNLQQIKEGKETAGLGSDTFVSAWTLLDQAVRQVVGQEIAEPEAKGFSVFQFLTKEDITFDPTQGWTGYPDYAERFAKIWGVEAPK